jgi:ATP-dependent Clp protease protease subunit
MAGITNESQGFSMPDEREPGMDVLSDHGVYYFASEFTTSSTKDVISWILENNIQKTRNIDHLTLMITSYGGDLLAAFALIDVMRGSKIPIHTIGLGIIASAGLMTFIAGEPGNRVITPNTSILSHQWSAGSFGKEHELIASSRQFDLISHRMISHYKKCTKLTEKQIREKLLPPQDVWLSAEEAKEYNLVDTVKQLR